MGDLAFIARIKGTNKNPSTAEDTIVALMDRPGSGSGCGSRDFVHGGVINFVDVAAVSASNFGCPAAVACPAGTTCTVAVYGGTNALPSGTKLADFTSFVTAGASEIEVCVLDLESGDSGAVAEIAFAFSF
jgi:hypothetical protein